MQYDTTVFDAALLDSSEVHKRQNTDQGHKTPFPDVTNRIVCLKQEKFDAREQWHQSVL